MLPHDGHHDEARHTLRRRLLAEPDLSGLPPHRVLAGRAAPFWRLACLQDANLGCAVMFDRAAFCAAGGYHAAFVAWRFEDDELAGRMARLALLGHDNRHDAMPAPGRRVLPLLLDHRAEVLAAMREADGYLMHSRHEGFGLVLLEAMVNETPRIAHATGGAARQAAFGQTCRSDAGLRRLLAVFAANPARIAATRDHALGAHDIRATLHDLETAARRAAAEPKAPPARAFGWVRSLRGAEGGARERAQKAVAAGPRLGHGRRKGTSDER